LLAAVALLLLIGCGNVSILLLARGTARQHELAVRSAIGAGRSRILRQLLAEALMLSFTGAVIGVALANSLVKLIVNWLPSSPSRMKRLSASIFGVVLQRQPCAADGIVFGISPALQSARPDVARVMQANTRKITAGVHGRRTHSVLIAGQIALTLLLLAGAGVAMQGFVRMMLVDLGYDPHNIMSVGIPVHDNTYTTWEARRTYFNQPPAKGQGDAGSCFRGAFDQCHTAKQWMGATLRDFRQAGGRAGESADQLHQSWVFHGASYSAAAGTDLG